MNLIQQIIFLKKSCGRPTEGNVPLFDLGYNKAIDDILPLIEEYKRLQHEANIKELRED